MIAIIKRRFSHLIEDPEYMFGKLWIKLFGANYTPDRLYLKVIFRQTMGQKLNLRNPKTFNEKLQWLKLYDRNPLYTTLVDKVEVKKWVADKIGEEYIIPTLGVYLCFEDIDFDQLPNQFVLKCTHDSGSVVICKDKTTFDIEYAKSILNKRLEFDYYSWWREWPYKNVQPRILAEKYISFDGDIIMDYRIYCFNGKPLLIYAYTNYAQKDGSKPEPSYCDYFDTDWNPVDFHQHSKPRGNVNKPTNLSIMLEKASLIAKDLPFVRVDFYESNVVNFGEITFYPGAGFSTFHPTEWDYKLGEWLKICDLKASRGG